MQAQDLDRDSGRWSPPLASTHDNIASVMSDTRDADTVLQTLQHSADHEELKTALIQLLTLFDTVPKFLEKSRAYLVVISTMTHMYEDMDVQNIGLDILNKFLKESQVMEERMQRSDAFKHVVRLLNDNCTDSDIQAKATGVLSHLLHSSHVKRHISHLRLWSFILEAMVKGISNFTDHEESVINALTIIIHVVEEDTSLREVVSNKHFPVLINVLNILEKKTQIVQKILDIFIIISEEEKVKLCLASTLPSIVIAQISAWQGDSIVVAKGFGLLEILCSEDSVCQILVEKDLIMRAILPEIMSKIDDADIQFCGLKIFVYCATRLFKKTSFGDLASQWLKIIYLCMSRHMARPEIQAQGCKALSKLLECKPEVYMWIGESSELKQDPLHTLCLGAILMYEKNEDVFVSACKAIYYLTADNDGLCKTLMEKNSHIAIVEGLRTHRENQKAITAACRAIRGLSIFQTAHKQEIAFYDGDLLHLLVSIIKNSSDLEVQSEVISTIACLADIDLFRHQAYIVGMHLHILSAMDNCPGDEILQEAAIEALAVLGGAASGPDILHSKGAVNKIIKCMKRFVYNSNIQKKGLMAIQILAKSELIQSMAMCQELATIIKITMRNYVNNLVLQKEAIVAMQILAERGVEEDSRDQYSHMAEVLVNQECHELLFQILEKFDNDPGLHDLASECLYVLGVEQDLKSRMLLTACSRGFIAGAECLIEVGADVNIGQGPESPLYFAVSNNDEKMVQFLLRHEVRDLQTSLRLSLERRQHRITGMILSHIGQDRETGTVLWSNLNLLDLRPEWIVPTLYCDWLQSHSSSITSKHFVAKIKDSQQRRNQRILHHCPSESSVEFIRNKCFRFRRSSLDVCNSTFEAIQELHAKALTQGKPRRPSMLLRLTSRHRSRKRIMGKDLIFKGEKDFMSTSTDITEEETPYDGLVPVLAQEDVPVFELSEDEWEDWRQTTLTGADIPFSPADPRQKAIQAKMVEDELKTTSVAGKWQRKYSMESAQDLLSNSLHIHLSEEIFYPASSHTSDESPLSTGVSDIPSSDTESGPPSQRNSTFTLSSDDTIETDFEASTEDSKPRSLYLIRSLDVSFNHIASLSHLATGGVDMMQSFASMEYLDLSHNDLESVPEQIFQSLTGLQTLNLGSNKLSEFPSCLSVCPRLVTLDLSSNKISDLSLNMPRGFSIIDLNLSKNQLTSFPDGLDLSMPHLSSLDVSCNKLTSLPMEPCNLTEVRMLDFSHNAVQILPDDFLKHCIKLETLMAGNNGLEILPSESLASTLTRMCTLKLFNNELIEKEPFFIPKFILELPNVRTVDLSSNGITGFAPPLMWKTQMLKDLIMSRNNITKLNLEGARSWAKLEKLHLSHNRIAELPREIGQLTSLQSLDLSHNKALSTLPDELGRCSRLWEMPMEGLSLDLDYALTRGRVKDLTMYLHHRLKKARHYYRMKLMVVGYGGRGKTSLLQSLKRRIKSSACEKPPVTVGVIVDEWKYERQRFNKTVVYTLNTWDFAGQEEFYSTHQCFLSNRTLYLVVYDISMGTDEIDKLKPWLSNIYARAPGCPVVVVGTHYDLLPQGDRESIVAEFEEKLKELTQKPGFPAIQCFAIVDLAKETPELEQLRKRVKDIVDDFKIKGQRVMGQKVPASYVRLGELLCEEAKNLQKSFPVIRHGQLIRLVRSANLDLDEEEDLKQAISFLHESGVLLHYNETALQMRDFYFINPGWLCRMMAQVVTVPQINPFIDRNGIMKRSSADMLFTGKEISGESRFTFPTQLIPQYLHLLERFEIALPRNTEELLIPSRLPFRRPAFEMPVQNKEELVFRYYVMPYTPIGFWSRLLTRLIVFAESKGAKNMLYLIHDPEIIYWREGIFVKWSQNAFFLLESYRSDSDEVHLTVPNSAPGCRILGYLVDHVDSLVDEWYPGLTSIDPLMGQELMEKFVPCTLCKDHQPYLFRFEDLLTQSENHVDIYCPLHDGNVEITKLAPDVMLADIEPNFHLELDKFEFKESPANLCGDGGFGSVYKAKYKGKIVAVKVFSPIGDIHPHKMLRQEATILRRLKHPSVIALVAVAVRPVRLVVMEYAPSKSLGEVFRSAVHLSRTLKLKISLQIAEGLDYLHSLMVIYRDMKPDNVLIFTLAPDALINAKITDYGISQFTTLFSLTAQEGTPAYRAPEVIRGEPYSYQADIFSLGVLMYMIVTAGIHPFDELEFKSEIDKAFADNQSIPQLTQRGCNPWPDFQDLITQCLNQVPDYRPKACEVYNKLKSAELFSLREIIHVSVGTTVECIASQFIGSKGVRLWVASGDNEYMQLTWLNLLDYRDESLHISRNRQAFDYSGMGTMFRDGRVLCILPLNQEYILLGTQAGKIWVFNTVRNELLHSTQQLQDSVLSLYLVQRKHPRTSYRGDDPLVLAGLANGKMALYPMSEILQESESDMKPIEMNLGEKYEPIRCILRCSDHKLVASCGTKVVVINTRISVAVENIFNTKVNSDPSSRPITAMACGRWLYLSHRSSNVLEAWDIAHGKLKSKLNISTVFKLSPKDGRITAVVLHDNKTLWVGTGGGQVLLIDVNNWVPIIGTHRHTASVRCMLNVKLRGSAKYGPNSRTNVILSGGLGFTTRSETDLDRENHYGCIGVWDAEFPQTVKQLSDWSRKRKEYIEKSSQHFQM